jgi:hypothetical protein
MTDHTHDAPRRALLTGAAFAAAGMALAPAAAEAVVAKGAKDAHTVKPGRHLYFVTSNAVAGVDREYEQWYVEHMKQITAIPGFISAQHFVYHPTNGRKEPAFHYMVIYEIEGDPDTVLAQMGPAVTAGRLARPDPKLFTPAGSWVYSPVVAG